MKANQIAVAGNRLVAVESDGRVAIYEIDTMRLLDLARARDATIEGCREAMEMPADAPAEARILAMESRPMAPLIMDVEQLETSDLSCAHFYARQLARTIDRIEEGIELLERLRPLAPENWRVADDVTAARARLNFREEAVSSEVPAARSAPELTIGTGATGLGPNVAISESNLFAWQWGYLGGEMICATVSVYDRKDIQLQIIIPVAACDNDFQDSITSVVENESYIYAALEYRYEQPGRPDLLVIHGQGLSVVGRYQLMGSISRLIMTDDGLIACRSRYECTLWNPDDFNRHSPYEPRYLAKGSHFGRP